MENTFGEELTSQESIQKQKVPSLSICCTAVCQNFYDNGILGDNMVYG
jgi:hypothetical protein